MIGVYDSGLGGLLELNKIKIDNPGTDILYLGDQDHAPYGNKSKELLSKIFEDNLNFFRYHNIDKVILACNTLCSTIDFAHYPDFYFFDLIKATVKQIDLPLKSKILVFATANTIRNGRYKKELDLRGYKDVKGVALNKLAEMIEGFASDEEIADYLLPIFKNIAYKPDAIILGCTHYPVVKEIFSSYYKVPLFDSTKLDFRIENSQEAGKIFIAMHDSEQVKKFVSRYVVGEVKHIAYEQKNTFSI